MNTNLCSTFITLIPKYEGVEEVLGFTPIRGLWGRFYKIILKDLAGGVKEGYEVSMHLIKVLFYMKYENKLLMATLVGW